VTTSADAIAFVFVLDLMKIHCSVYVTNEESNSLKISLSDFSINQIKYASSFIEGENNFIKSPFGSKE
jgi:hypothetical protein